uniref:CCHC-type domain-containing protein n=1 Tax=Neogobius melanostomus TaxID=47308 RepID=A0A8C6TUG2_9GOBI
VKMSGRGKGGMHQVRQCPLVKCWRCGHFGHKAKDCQSEALCSLCDERGIIYPDQNTTCFICQSPEHQVRQCPLVKCWRCGHFGHKAKDCQSEALCSLCDERGHTYFTCPSSYKATCV